MNPFPTSEVDCQKGEFAVKYAMLLLASLGSSVLTLVVFATEANASVCTSACISSSPCNGTNQVCDPCSYTNGAGSCGTYFRYFNAPVLVVQGGSSNTLMTPVNCSTFANCTAGAGSSFTDCGPTGCGGFSINTTCYPCATGAKTTSTVNECSDLGCNEA